MKHLLIIILGILSLLNCRAQSKKSTSSIIEEIDSLFAVKSYFKAQELFESHKGQFDPLSSNRISAGLSNIFNKIEDSKLKIERLLSQSDSKLTTKQKKDLLITQLSNSVKSFDYRNANLISKRLIGKSKEIISISELESIKNNNIIWEALSSYPKQTVEFYSDTSLKLVRDNLGLKNLSVKVDSIYYPFILDTGANLSVIIESQAKAMNMEIIDVKVSVNTITGQRVDSKVGVANKLMIGNMYFNNVVFLVFPDEALFIPQFNHQIMGIIGFPVLQAMKEIHFLKNDTIFIPRTSKLNYPQNLAIEYLTPIVNLRTPYGNMSFTFDSGANKTFLYRKFFELRKEHILKNYSETNIQFAGGGGELNIKGFYIEFQSLVNNKPIAIGPVAVIPKTIDESDRHLYGNIGQDFISKFNKMIINFESMFLRFE